MFVSKAGVESGAVESYQLQKRIEVVKDCRKIGKKDMKFNDATPKMTVDPESFVSLPAFGLKVSRQYLHETNDQSFEGRPLRPMVWSVERRQRLQSHCPCSTSYIDLRGCCVTTTFDAVCDCYDCRLMSKVFAENYLSVAKYHKHTADHEVSSTVKHGRCSRVPW